MIHSQLNRSHLITTKIRGSTCPWYTANNTVLTWSPQRSGVRPARDTQPIIPFSLDHHKDQGFDLPMIYSELNRSHLITTKIRGSTCPWYTANYTVLTWSPQRSGVQPAHDTQRIKPFSLDHHKDHGFNLPAIHSQLNRSHLITTKIMGSTCPQYTAN